MDFLLIVGCVLYLVQTISCQHPQVKIPQGLLEGRYFTSRNDKTFAKFLGIPYAAPPVGELRFKSPQPAAGWVGTREAAKYGSECPQSNILFSKLNNGLSGNEDCLFLNVFTPKVAPDSYLPVMVWFHGGGFIEGSSKDFMGPDYIMDKDVVLVTVNYRLGALGFLTTEDEVLPGNFGLKDQSYALQWVRDNIEYFGGNKDSVTIFGQSAGGGSVNLHMMSPLSKGLFHAAIAQSGTAYCPWASYPSGINKFYAKKVGEIVGCPLENSKQFVKCLRKLPYEKFSVLNSVFTIWSIDPIVVFRPNIETSSKGAFLSTYPSQMITSVPYMVGLVSEEGGMRLSSLTKDGLDVGMKEMNDKFDKIMAMSLMVHEKTLNPEDVVKKVKNFYFGDKKIKKEDLQKAMNMYTDSLFLHGIIQSIHHHKGPAYLYYFNYKGDNSIAHMYGNKKDDFGVTHGDDLLYLTPLEGTPKLTEEDTKMSEKVVELWTNFATYRNPTPKRSSFATWEPVTSSDLEYLDISNDGFTMKTNLLKERYDFWNSLKLQDNLSGIRSVNDKILKDEL